MELNIERRSAMEVFLVLEGMLAQLDRFIGYCSERLVVDTVSIIPPEPKPKYDIVGWQHPTKDVEPYGILSVQHNLLVQTQTQEAGKSTQQIWAGQYSLDKAWYTLSGLPFYFLDCHIKLAQHGEEIDLDKSTKRHSYSSNESIEELKIVDSCLRTIDWSEQCDETAY